MSTDKALLICLLVEALSLQFNNVIFSYLNIGKPKIKILLLYVLNIALTCGVYLTLGKQAAEVWNIISMVLYCVLNNDTTKASFRLLMGVISVMCLFISDVIASVIFMFFGIYSFTSNFDEHISMHIKYEPVILMLISTLTLIFSIIVSMLHSKKRFTTINWTFLFSSVIQFAFVIYISRTMADNNIQIKLGSLIVFVVIVLVCIIFDAIIIKLSNKIVEDKFQSEKNSFLEYYEKMYQDYHTKTEKNLLEIRKIKHDFNNSMQVVKSLIANNDLQDASDLVSQLEQQYKSNNAINFCSNPILNVILQNANEQCSNNNIEFTTKCAIPEKLSINAVDMCNISNNMLNNAFEAVCNIKSTDIPKKISFRAWQDNEMIFIETINSKDTNINVKAKKIITSKQDAENHGFGLDIIEHIALTYNGNVIVDYDKTSFKVLVQLSVSN
ncbi:MAG: GHKL domain-containing protein [Ruminococcus sp.]|nr:GHKL domain-containing protein [Ruminococcus sp.]